MMLGSVAEAVSIGSVVPFISLIFSSPNDVVSFGVDIFKITELSHDHLLFWATFGLLAAIIFAGLLRFALLWCQAKLIYNLGSDLAVKVYKNTLLQPYEAHGGRNSSELIAAISSKTGAIVHGSLMPVLNIMNGVLVITVITTMLLVINFKATAWVFVALLFSYLTVLNFTKKSLIRLSVDISSGSNLIIRIFQESMGSIRHVILDNSQADFIDIYTKADVRLRRAQADLQIIGGFPRFFIEIVAMSAIVLLAFFMASASDNLITFLPTLAAFALAGQRLLPISQMMYSSFASIRGTIKSLNDVVLLLDQTVPPDSLSTQTSKLPFIRQIELKEICFRYPSSSKYVLEDVFLTIKKGEHIGIKGTTGSGKSTLVDVLIGLLGPTSGTLTVDGNEVTGNLMRAWQNRISHVSQDIFLLDASVAENIAFTLGREAIDQKKLEESCRGAQILDTISSWENTFNTEIGENGVRLSGGQRQRIAIARALYNQTDVIVFDEATSALDVNTEADIIEYIASIGDATTIVQISHREATLRCCDRIYEIENGKLAPIPQQKIMKN